MQWENFVLRLRSFSPFIHTAVKCGHKTRLVGKVSAFGDFIRTEIFPDENDGSVDYCHKCLSAMAIRCGWCGLTIFIGDPVTLYTPSKDFQAPDYAVVYSTDPLQLVGCLRWECADTGGDHAGYWLPDEDGKGHVERIQSDYEQILGEDLSPGTVISTAAKSDGPPSPHGGRMSF